MTRKKFVKTAMANNYSRNEVNLLAKALQWGGNKFSYRCWADKL